MSLVDDVRAVLCAECYGAPVLFERESDVEIVLKIAAERASAETGAWTKRIAEAMKGAGFYVARSRMYISVTRYEDRQVPPRIPDFICRRSS